MFNLDGGQLRIIRLTVGSAVAFWLFSQISDSSLFERLWGQVAILSLGVGALRVWLLESARPKGSR